jgi:hypothetical protein
MPTPRRSGAPLTPISIVSPGSFGLNKQAAGSLLEPQWATQALNFVFDGSGRLASREGFSAVSPSDLGGYPNAMGEWRNAGASVIVWYSNGDNKLYGQPSSPADLTGSLTLSAQNWKFFNFNSSIIGMCEGQQPISWGGSGSFVEVAASSGSAPQGNTGLGFAGRMWGAEAGGQVLKYSAILNAAQWDVTDGAGSFDFTSVWPNGADSITALALYNGRLVVFGNNSILFLSDNTGSALGIDPANASVVDTIDSVGCVARDSVQEIEGGDLIFLSSSGLQSLSALIQEKSNPMTSLSANIRDYLIQEVILDGDPVSTRSVYSPENKFYLLLGAQNTFCFDVSARLPDGTFRVTEWDYNISCMVRSSADGTLYAGRSGANRVLEYGGTEDFDNGPFEVSYSSPWMNFGEEVGDFLKILKNISVTTSTTAAMTSAYINWSVDFSTTPSLAQFYPTTGISKKSIYGQGTGQYYQVGVYAYLADDSPLTIQEMTVYAKLGRLAK